MKTKTRARKPPVPLEREIQKGAIAILKANGIIVHRRNVIAVPAEYKGRRRFIRAGEPGQSDLWGVIPPKVLSPAARLTWGKWGRHYEAECKRLGERPTLDQLKWLLEMNDATGAAFWFDSTEVLVKVMRCLVAGGRVEYLETQRKYGKIYGPSGDFDIVWPDDH